MTYDAAFRNILFNQDMDKIIDYAHWQNWAPDLQVVREIYNTRDDAYSVLTPFMYTYLEELIRSNTSEYGRDVKVKFRKVGNKLIDLAIKENPEKTDFIALLEELRKYFTLSTPNDFGDNRNSTLHGYMHPRFWKEENFEQLVHDIARLSPFANF